jgi:hypothetical protein
VSKQRRWKVGDRLTLDGSQPVEFYGYADDDPTGAYVYKLGGGGVWYVGTWQLSKGGKA